MTTIGPDSVIGGRYRVAKVLGEGGMGAVYEAVNLRTHRRVAIKTMRPEVASRPEFARRFEREAQAAGQLQHAHIVDVLDLGDDPELGLVFIVQEFLSGGDLGAGMKAAGALDPRVALATLLPIVDALAAAHRAGIVHRDVKPDNIFLHETPDGVVPKLIDFGIARLDSTDERSRTATGTVIGSPSYMSPEQAHGDNTLDAMTDVWSLGVVFHEALSGQLPYDAPSVNALIAKIIYEEPTALSVHAPQVPRDLAAAIQRAVTRDRAARWPTMQAFGEALRACALWRGVEPSTAARWIINAQGASSAPPPRTEPMDVLGSTMEAPPASAPAPAAQRSDVWNGEVREPPAPLGRPWRSAVAVGGLTAALALTAVITLATRTSRPHVAPTRAAVPPPQAVEAPPPVVTTPVTAPALAEARPVEVAPGVADAGAAPAVRVTRRARRRDDAPTPPAVVATPAPAQARRGFNGARILE